MISELRTLVAIARHGTFAAAGDHIGLTQAAVSGHVSRLERSLGYSLFERTGRSAVLNQAGLRTLLRAEEVIAKFDALGADLDEDVSVEPLRIGAIASVQANLLVPALVPFRAAHPDCRIHVSPGVSIDLFDAVDAGSIDFAIMIRPAFRLPHELAWRPLMEEEYVLLIPDDEEEGHWRDVLSNRPFIRYDRASFGGRRVERLLRSAGVTPVEWLEVDDIQAMVVAVSLGLGVAILPLSGTVLPLPRGIRRVSLGRNAVVREIGILIKRGIRRAPVSTLIELLTMSASARSDPRPAIGKDDPG